MPRVHDVAELVATAAAEDPDRVALVEPGRRSMTWAELEDEVARLATGLGVAGVVGGQRVLLALGNRLELVTAYLGVLRAQAVAVPVNPRSTADELERMLEDSGARVALADADTADAVRDAASALPSAPRVVVVGEESFDELRHAPARAIPPLQDPEKLAALLYTSGTSGRPRAAMLTHRALLANVDQVAEVDPPMIRRDDVVLGVLPLFHVYGLNAVLGAVLRHRARLVVVERFEPVGTLATVVAEGCTVLPVAPPVFAYWEDVPDLAEHLGSVRLVLSGSAPLSAEAVERFRERTGVPVHQGYGLTEASPVVTSTLCSGSPRAGSVGAALPGVGLRLLDETGHEPEGDDPGEIQVRGANLFSGYWPDGSGGPDAEGWWSTGDVGFLDEDGDLVLVDRLKELVIVSGFNVYPTEVEDVVSEVPGVVDAGVIGVEDPLTGEAVVAFVVAGPDAGDPDDLVEAVRAHCAQRLAGFKRPARVEVVEELPKTVTGKVQKGRLRGIERRRTLGLIE